MRQIYNVLCRLGQIFGIFIAISAIFSANPGDLRAQTQAEKAVAAVKKLVDSGRISNDTIIKIMAKEGNINNIWGNDFEIKDKWEQQTGILIDARIRQNLPVLDFISKDKDFDITLARQREYPDLYTKNYITDLTPFVKKYGLVLDENSVNGFFSPKIQSEFDNKVVAIPADGDIAMLYIRKDLMEDPTNKTRFRKKYKRDLKLPDTWDEYQDLIEFFHNPQKGFYGTCEQRDPQTGWMFWMPRYASQDYPNQYLFDDNMHPLVNSRAGIAATESYLKTIPFSPPKILDKWNHYSYAVPIYKSGNAFSYMLTMAAAKMLNTEPSAVKGKFIACLSPGTMVRGKLVRRTSYIYGNNIVVSKVSKHKDLAFLFAMWLSAPDISTQSIMVTSGLADPFRVNHLKDRRVWPIYSTQALGVLEKQVGIAVPEGTGVPGDFEYIKTLNKNLWAAAKGELTAKRAMEKTAGKWEEITERYGREKQIRYWRAFKKKYPGVN
ncbi:MAG: extracellular solute-binding protein [Desulfobacterales bacterium]|nr:extracellular solute-binding protein [Desulfobacterales bacterium]